MPIYEYQCEKCGEFEITRRITEEPLKKCPTCKRKVRKLMSSTSFQLKGSGWYVTDYARKGKDAGSGGGEAKPSGGGESKAAKSETASSSESKTTSSDTSSSSGGESKPKSSKKDSTAKAA